MKIAKKMFFKIPQNKADTVLYIVAQREGRMKHDMFVARIFTQTNPVLVGNLGTTDKKLKKYGWGFIFYIYSAKFFVNLVG